MSVIVRHVVFKIWIARALSYEECSRNSNFEYIMTNYDELWRSFITCRVIGCRLQIAIETSNLETTVCLALQTLNLVDFHSHTITPDVLQLCYEAVAAVILPCSLFKPELVCLITPVYMPSTTNTAFGGLPFSHHNIWSACLSDHKLT